MAKCYILGAGASYGYDENILPELRPPLTEEFFVKGVQLLGEERYKRLRSSLGEYLKINGAVPDFSNPNSLKIDIERFLSWLSEEFHNQSNSTTLEFERNNFFQGALSECFFYIYDILRYYSLSYKPRFDSYRRLALHYHDSKYTVITLNYDVLFEAAINSVGVQYHYFAGAHHPKSIPIAKIHGSINWINPLKGGIAYGGAETTFSTIITPIFSNKFYVGQMMVLPIGALRDIEALDFVRSGFDYDEPALIPPLANYKDYEKVSKYKEIWDFAASILREASELVVLGCSLRKEDIKFCELLSGAVRDSVDVTVVDRNAERVVERLRSILRNPNVRNTFNSFVSYSKTL